MQIATSRHLLSLLQAALCCCLFGCNRPQTKPARPHGSPHSPSPAVRDINTVITPLGPEKIDLRIKHLAEKEVARLVGREYITQGGPVNLRVYRTNASHPQIPDYVVTISLLRGSPWAFFIDGRRWRIVAGPTSRAGVDVKVLLADLTCDGLDEIIYMYGGGGFHSHDYHLQIWSMKKRRPKQLFAQTIFSLSEKTGYRRGSVQYISFGAADGHCSPKIGVSKGTLVGIRGYGGTITANAHAERQIYTYVAQQSRFVRMKPPIPQKGALDK